MTNEELAERIQTGEKQLCSQLWAQVKRFVYMQAARYGARTSGICRCSGVELDDLEQEAYLAMLDAVKAYDSQSGFLFTTYLHRHLLNHWRSLLGLRTVKGKNNPLNLSIRLESPIGAQEDENITVGDMIPDSGAEQALESAIDGIYRQQLHDVLECCITSLPERKSDTIRGRYYRGETLKQIANRWGVSISSIKDLEKNSLRDLKRGQNYQRLKGWREDIISRYAYKGTMYPFKVFGGSVVERTVEKLDKLEHDFTENFTT